MSKLNVGDLCDGTNEKKQQQSTDESAVTLRHANTLCPKARKFVRPRSRSYSTPGERSRCNESDFSFAPHLDLDRQMLFDPKKVELEEPKLEDEADNEQSLDDLDQQDVEEEETSF